MKGMKISKKLSQAKSVATESVHAAATQINTSATASATAFAAYKPGAKSERYLLVVKVVAAREMKWSSVMVGFSKFNPYCAVFAEKIKIGSTTVSASKDAAEPRWNETFYAIVSSFLPDTHPNSLVTVALQDHHEKITHDIGAVKIPNLEKTANPATVEPKWYTIEKNKGTGQLLVSACLVPIEEVSKMDHDPTNDLSLRSGCNVRLYQNAYSAATGRHTFEDMYRSLNEAKEYIYITGWSVWTKLPLLRGKDCELLGDLLLRRANEGVQVCIIVWDEITSVEGVAAEGLMNTYDEETRNFFKDTKVSVRGLHRRGYMGIEEVIFSHHQKTIICDLHGQVTAYVGGLDLTCGRFDSADHHIFGSLKKEHSADFYNACIPGAKVETGPRQPWQDIHSYVEGRLAIDVFENFRQRWHFKQGDKMRAKSELKNAEQCELKNVSGMPHATNGNWECQLLRSIDRFSIECGDKDDARVIRSIHNTYVIRIMNAKRFIYIENQYFMGSSHYWGGKVDPSLRNLIPIAIVEKIISKIAAGEDFVAYLIVPLFPEGVPESVGVQAMLRWQFNTVKMMYKRITDALKLHGSNRSARDYLVFMTVTKKESNQGMEPSQLPSVLNQRHMIYVHSKMILIDDEYILVGSANINDRSMRGNRDTEIAAIYSQKKLGGEYSKEICNFRLALWESHFGGAHGSFMVPQSLDCSRYIQDVAKKNWDVYTSSNMNMKGHACMYPYQLGADGVLTASPNSDAKFPDFPLAFIEGQLSILPNHVTT